MNSLTTLGRIKELNSYTSGTSLPCLSLNDRTTRTTFKRIRPSVSGTDTRPCAVQLYCTRVPVAFQLFIPRMPAVHEWRVWRNTTQRQTRLSPISAPPAIYPPYRTIFRANAKTINTLTPDVSTMEFNNAVNSYGQ